MALTGSSIASTYLKLLRVNTDTMGADASASYIQDSADTDSALSISTTRIGIGTDSPDTTLHIYSTSASKPILKIENEQGGANPVSIQLLRNTSSPADDDSIGQIDFRSMNDAGTPEEILYAYISGFSTDITDGTEDGELQFHTMKAGTLTNTMTMQSGNVGIGTASPDYSLEIESATSTKLNLKNTGDGQVDLSADRGTAADGQGLLAIKGVWAGNNVCAIEMQAGDDTTNKDNGQIALRTSTAGSSNVTRIQIDESGNVGIGTTSPSSLLSLVKADADCELRLHTYSDTESQSNYVTFRKADGSEESPALVDDNAIIGGLSFQAYDGSGWHESASIKAQINGTPSDGTDMPTELLFATANESEGSPTTRMTISPLGRVGIATGGTNYNRTFTVVGNSRHKTDETSGDAKLMWFSDGDDTECGYIELDTTNNTTTYSTTSDYRLKENEVFISDGLERLNKLKPYRFNFISNPAKIKVDGFFAHEVSDIVPEAISGEKDAMKEEEVSPAIQAVEGVEGQEEITWTDKPTEENTKDEIKAWMDSNELEYNSGDTKQDLLDKIPEVQQEFIQSVEAVEAVDAVYESVPDYQGIDQSKLVPLLVAAIQELSAKVEALENA